MKYCGSVSMVVKKVDMGQQTPPRVLIVEDNPLIAMGLEDILEGFGCQVVGPISTLKETLERLEEGADRRRGRGLSTRRRKLGPDRGNPQREKHSFRPVHGGGRRRDQLSISAHPYSEQTIQSR